MGEKQNYSFILKQYYKNTERSPTVFCCGFCFLVIKNKPFTSQPTAPTSGASTPLPYDPWVAPGLHPGALHLQGTPSFCQNKAIVCSKDKVTPPSQRRPKPFTAPEHQAFQLLLVRFPSFRIMSQPKPCFSIWNKVITTQHDEGSTRCMVMICRGRVRSEPQFPHRQSS